jgi:mono/diheme cytochrome c family protein
MKWTLKPFAVTLVLAGASPVHAANGAALYDKTCASCHGKGGKNGKASPIAGRSEQVVTANIKEHPLSMNSFELSEAETKAIAKYVAGLKP